MVGIRLLAMWGEFAPYCLIRSSVPGLKRTGNVKMNDFDAARQQRVVQIECCRAGA
jgi:hypothetical protein